MAVDGGFLTRSSDLSDAVELLNEFGQRKGSTSSRAAFACLLAQRPWIVPIPAQPKLK
jgi:hypothetical protein